MVSTTEKSQVFQNAVKTAATNMGKDKAGRGCNKSLAAGRLGVKVDCPDMARFAPSDRSSRYTPLHVDRRFEFADAESFDWGTVNMSNEKTINHPAVDEEHPFLTQEMFMEDRDSWLTENVVKNGKLPKGMRYAVDWRYIGGIPPTANGQFKERSIRRWVRPVQTSQCGSICTLTGMRQEMSLHRCAQLGEMSRHRKIANVPYLYTNHYKHKFYYANSYHTQLAKDNFVRVGNEIVNEDDPLETWVEVKTDEETGELINYDYALDTEGQKAERKLVQSVDNVLSKEEFNWPSKRDDPKAQASQVYTSNKVDPYFTKFVDEDYKVPDGLQIGSEKVDIEDWVHLAPYNPVGNCADPSWNRYRKSLKNWRSDGKNKWGGGKNKKGVTPIELLAYKGDGKWERHFQSNKKVRKQAPFKSAKEFGGAVGATSMTRNYNWSWSTNGRTRENQYSIHSPLYVCKNQGTFLTGEMAEASPAIFLAWVLDNYGPVVHSFANSTSGDNFAEHWRLSGGTIKELGKILYPELMLTGYNDAVDRAVRASLDGYTTANYLKGDDMRAGTNSGHTCVCVGYYFLPDAKSYVTDEESGETVLRDDPQMVFIYMNSHFNAGTFQGMRGFIVRTMSLTHGVLGINELRTGIHLWNPEGRPIKYFYDGTAYVPDSLPQHAGGSNEVRGLSPYDWRQTIDYDQSGRTREFVKEMRPEASSEDTKMDREIFEPPKFTARVSSEYDGFFVSPNTQCEGSKATKTYRSTANLDKKIKNCKGKCKFVEVDETANTVKFYQSCALANDDTGTTVYVNNDVKDARSQNGLQRTIVDQYYNNFRSICRFQRGPFPEHIEGYHTANGQGVEEVIKEVSASTAENCATKCNEDEKCTHFTWDASSRMCEFGTGLYAATRRSSVNRPTYVKFSKDTPMTSPPVVTGPPEEEVEEEPESEDEEVNEPWIDELKEEVEQGVCDQEDIAEEEDEEEPET